MTARRLFRGRERAGIYGMRLHLMRHPLGALLAPDVARRAGLSSRPRLRPEAWSAWCVAEGSGWKSVATSVERRAPRACARRADEGGRWAGPQLGGCPGPATRRVRCRPARRLKLRRSGALVAKGRTVRIARQPAQPVVAGVVESEAAWRVSPTVTGRLTRACSCKRNDSEATTPRPRARSHLRHALAPDAPPVRQPKQSCVLKSQ